MSVPTYRVKNTADHEVQVGQTVILNDTEYVIASVSPARHEPLILTYGSKLIPESVTITVRPVEEKR